MRIRARTVRVSLNVGPRISRDHYSKSTVTAKTYRALMCSTVATCGVTIVLVSFIAAMAWS